MPFPRTAPADTEILPPGAALPVACCCVAAGDSTITVPSAPILIVMNSTSVTARCRPCSTPGGDVQDSPPCTGGRPWSRPRPQRHLLDRARMQMRGNARAALEARPVNAPLGATSATQALPSRANPRAAPTSPVRRSECLALLVRRHADRSTPARSTGQASAKPGRASGSPYSTGSSAPTVRPAALPLHLRQHPHCTRARQFERVRDVLPRPSRARQRGSAPDRHLLMLNGAAGPRRPILRADGTSARLLSAGSRRLTRRCVSARKGRN